MKILEGLPMDQIFGHTDDKGVVREFNTSAMLRAMMAKKVKPKLVECDLCASLVEHIEKNHGVEQDHLARITDEMLESPIVIAEFNDGKNLVVDGSHRVVKRWRKGLTTVKAIVFTEEQWTPFLVTDMGAEYTQAEVMEMMQRLLDHGDPDQG